MCSALRASEHPPGGLPGLPVLTRLVRGKGGRGWGSASSRRSPLRGLRFLVEVVGRDLSWSPLARRCAACGTWLELWSVAPPCLGACCCAPEPAVSQRWFTWAPGSLLSNALSCKSRSGSPREDVLLPSRACRRAPALDASVLRLAVSQGLENLFPTAFPGRMPLGAPRDDVILSSRAGCPGNRLKMTFCSHPVHVVALWNLMRQSACSLCLENVL